METKAVKDHDGTEISLVVVTGITEPERAEERAARTQAPIQPSAEMLSNREMEVLRLLGRGLTSKQMATMLSISSRTVDSHRQKIMQKLEISNGPGLVKFAIHHGFDR